MNIQSDFEEFLKFLEAHQVDYMIVGGYAVAFHGFPRYTNSTEVTFIGRQELIRNKSSTQRAKDKADVEELT